MLSENRANVNAGGGYHGTAIQASYLGDEKIVRMLFKNEAKINVESGYDGNALQSALPPGHGDIAKLLLENGADINSLKTSEAASHSDNKEVTTLTLNALKSHSPCVHGPTPCPEEEHRNPLASVHNALFSVVRSARLFRKIR